MSQTAMPCSRRAGGSFLFVAFVLSLAWACNSAPPTEPTPTPTPSSFYQLSGHVKDEAGLPIAGIQVNVDYYRLGGTLSNPPSMCYGSAYCWLKTQTNGSGDYGVELDAGPTPQHLGAIGYAFAEHRDYEANLQMVSVGQEVIQDLRMRSIRALTAGESISISVEPDSSRCSDLEYWWDLNSRCEAVRVVANTAGTLIVEARTETGDGAPTMFFAMLTGEAGVGVWTGPGALSIPVKGGTYLIYVGRPADQIGQRAERFAHRFNVTTSLR